MGDVHMGDVEMGDVHMGDIEMGGVHMGDVEIEAGKDMANWEWKDGENME